MHRATLGTELGPLTGSRLFACVAEHGSAAHPYHGSAELLKGPHSTRNLADVVHLLGAVHGRSPGVIDHAAMRSTGPAARAWLRSASEGFASERAFLAELVVEAGPVPSTPAASSAEAALMAQRHALDMLAQSERDGCALGAAMALVVDWGRIRYILNTAAGRFGVPPAPYRLMDDRALAAAADAIGQAPIVERAMLFGAQQIMLQHRGFWDIMEARALAREGR